VVHPREVQGLAAAARALGAELPETLAATAQLLADVEAERPVRDEVRNAQVQAAAFAPDATSESVLEAIQEAAEDAAGTAFSARLKEVAVAALVTRFVQELRSGAGDELLDALRPGFEAKVAAPFAEATRLGVVGQSAEALLANGTPEQQDAWRALPAAQLHGDAVHRLILGLVGAFQLLPAGGEFSPRALAAAFHANDAHTFQLSARAFARGNTDDSRAVRGGTVWSTGNARLNTLAETLALVAEAAHPESPERERVGGPDAQQVNTLHDGEPGEYPGI
jgi:hypothetical protein